MILKGSKCPHESWGRGVVAIRRSDIPIIYVLSWSSAARYMFDYFKVYVVSTYPLSPSLHPKPNPAQRHMYRRITIWILAKGERARRKDAMHHGILGSPRQPKYKSEVRQSHHFSYKSLAKVVASQTLSYSYISHTHTLVLPNLECGKRMRVPRWIGRKWAWCVNSKFCSSLTISNNTKAQTPLSRQLWLMF